MEELWRTKRIDSVEEVSAEDITLDNLAVKFCTGCNVNHGSGANRVVTYRNGYATELGNIEKSVWTLLAKQAVEKELGCDVYAKVVAFLQHFGTPVQKRDAEQEALEICASHLFEDENWEYYHKFQRCFSES